MRASGRTSVEVVSTYGLSHCGAISENPSRDFPAQAVPIDATFMMMAMNAYRLNASTRSERSMCA